jgi:hypothetical protein
MKHLLLVLIGTFLFSHISMNAQHVRTKDGENFGERKIEAAIEKMENKQVEIVKVKTMKKWKALGLSSEMKDKMDYHVVRVRYIVDNTLKTMVIDVNLVPIEYDYANLQ